MVTSLAESDGTGSVRICSCGFINVNIGAVTLHIDKDTFLKSSLLMQNAAAKIAEIKNNKSGKALHSEIGTAGPGCLIH